MMKFIQISEKDNFITLTLNRPDVRNAFNPEMISELKSAFQKMSTQKNLRAVIIKGEGKSFCAGADLGWMKDMVQYSLAENKKDSLDLFSMYESIDQCPIPVISVVHGAAFGGALGIIACSDYVLSEEKTQFCFSEVKLGIAPAVISAFVLKKANLGLVQPLMLSGKVFSAADANRIGLVHDIGDDENLPDKLDAVINSFRLAGPAAVRATKALLNSMSQLNWQQQKERTTDLISQLRVSQEGQAGLQSFLEKRETPWSRR
jgi:methylglutaconyl-CoA hydratase